LAVSTPAFAAPRGVKSLGDEARQAKWALKATVTIAPKLAVILHRMWIDQTEFNWSKKEVAA
jgi:transposase